jgi:spore coat protein U-like protein
VRRIAGLAALMLLVPVAGHAACSVTASGVAFGVYQPFIGTPRDFTGTVTVNCTFLSNFTGAYNVKLSIGGGASYPARRMTSAGVNLTYQLYTDAAHTLIWGDGTGGSTLITGSDNRPLRGGTTIFNVFGRIPVAQAAKPNTYTDNSGATLTY